MDRDILFLVRRFNLFRTFCRHAVKYGLWHNPVIPSKNNISLSVMTFGSPTSCPHISHISPIEMGHQWDMSGRTIGHITDKNRRNVGIGMADIGLYIPPSIPYTPPILLHISYHTTHLLPSFFPMLSFAVPIGRA